MPIRPILSIESNPTVRLDSQRVMERPETAAWVTQCIANWSWVESTIGSLFVNLLGTNLPAGAVLYNDMASSVVKDQALRSVALTALNADEYRLLEAILKIKGSYERTRNKLAHWSWGVCKEIPDGLVLYDPRYFMLYRATILALHEKGQLHGAEIDREKLYVVRPKDLEADAKDFAEFAKLVFSFANLVAEKDPKKRAQRYLALSNDARIQEALAQGNRSTPQTLQITPPSRRRKPRQP